MRIIWITGPAAAGKWTVVDYLVNKCWFLHYSVSWYLTEILENEWKEVNRDTMRYLADSLRAEHGSSYIVWELYKKASAVWENAIIESIRTVWEVELLKKQSNFILLSVDADQKVRYERALQRNSAKDHIDFDTFKKQEALEASNEDINKWNILACQKLADYTLDNNSDSSTLYKKIDEMIEWLSL